MCFIVFIMNVLDFMCVLYNIVVTLERVSSLNTPRATMTVVVVVKEREETRRPVMIVVVT